MLEAQMMSSGTPILLLVLAATGLALVALVGATFFTVERRTAAIVQRLGRFTREAGAGIQWKLPLVDRVVGRVNLRVQQLDVAATERGEADRVLRVKAAEGDAQSKALQGQGIADQRQAIVAGLRDSVDEFRRSVPGTTAKDVMNLVLMTQYFDMLKEIGSSSRTNAILIPHSPGNLTTLTEQMRSAMMRPTRSAGHPFPQSQPPPSPGPMVSAAAEPTGAEALLDMALHRAATRLSARAGGHGVRCVCSRWSMRRTRPHCGRSPSRVPEVVNWLEAGKHRPGHP